MIRLVEARGALDISWRLSSKLIDIGTSCQTQIDLALR